MIKYSIVLLCTASHAFRGIVVFSVLLFGFVPIVVFVVLYNITDIV